MVLEISQPPPSTGDIALMLLAGACVSLRQAASVATSLVPMLSWGGQAGSAGMDSGGPGRPSGQMGVKGWRVMSPAVPCQDWRVGVFAGVGAVGMAGPGVGRGRWHKVWVVGG